MWQGGHSLKAKRSKSLKVQESKSLRVWPRLMRISGCCFSNWQQESASIPSRRPCRPIRVSPERSNVSPLTGRELAWRPPMPKASSASGTRLPCSNKRGTVNRSSVRERHLGFHARVAVVLSIDIAENLEGQVAGAMSGRHAPNAKLVLHLPSELRNIAAVVWKQVESAFD